MACLVFRIEELQTQLDAAHSTRGRQEALSSAAAGAESSDSMHPSPAEQQLRAKLELLQRQLRMSQVLGSLMPCQLVRLW